MTRTATAAAGLAAGIMLTAGPASDGLQVTGRSRRSVIPA